MKRPIALVILIALNFIVVWAQQTDKPTLTPPTMAQIVSPTAPLADVGSSQLTALRSPYGQPKIESQMIRPAGQSMTPVGTFVVMNGAVYVVFPTYLPGDKFLVPMSGGGASGCFSVDLPGRIEKPQEFMPKLESLEPPKSQM